MLQGRIEVSRSRAASSGCQRFFKSATDSLGLHGALLFGLGVLLYVLATVGVCGLGIWGLGV